PHARFSCTSSGSIESSHSFVPAATMDLRDALMSLLGRRELPPLTTCEPRSGDTSLPVTQPRIYRARQASWRDMRKAWRCPPHAVLPPARCVQLLERILAMLQRDLYRALPALRFEHRGDHLDRGAAFVNVALGLAIIGNGL